MSNSTSDEPESSYLSVEDATIIKSWIIGEAVEGLLYGIEALLAISAVFILLRQGMTKSWSRWFMFMSIIVMFTASTMNLVGDLKVYTVQIQILGDDPNFDPTPVMVKWNVIKVIFARISYFLGDLIVIWRAWILFPNHRNLRSVLAACGVISLGIIIADIVLAIRANVNKNFQIATIILPIGFLITNICIAVLVAFKTWLLRDFIKNTYGDSSKGTKFQQLLFLLAEAGVFYCVIWILIFLEVPKTVFGEGPADAVASTLPHLGNIYATTIIILIIVERTHFDTTLQGQLPKPAVDVTAGKTGLRGGNAARMTLSQSIQFRPNTSTHHTQSVSFPVTQMGNPTGTMTGTRDGATTPGSENDGNGSSSDGPNSEKVEVKVEKTEIA